MARLDDIEYLKRAALVHSDERRRDIYDPEKILEGLDNYGSWFAHNIITITKTGAHLGNHHHDYLEVFFTPTGSLEFLFATEDNPEDIRNFVMEAGSRLFIPEGVDHRVIGHEGNVLMGYGNARFDRKRLIKSSKEVLEAFNRYSH